MAAVFDDVEPLVQKLRDSETRHVETLRELVQRMKEARLEDDRAFAQLFALATEIFHRSDSELAKELHVARPTIGRWARGESCPHPLSRKSVFQVLLKMADEDIRRHSPERPALARIRRAA
jgi:hypothetical protein